MRRHRDHRGVKGVKGSHFHPTQRNAAPGAGVEGVKGVKGEFDPIGLDLRRGGLWAMEPRGGEREYIYLSTYKNTLYTLYTLYKAPWERGLRVKGLGMVPYTKSVNPLQTPKSPVVKGACLIGKTRGLHAISPPVALWPNTLLSPSTAPIQRIGVGFGGPIPHWCSLSALSRWPNAANRAPNESKRHIAESFRSIGGAPVPVGSPFLSPVSPTGMATRTRSKNPYKFSKVPSTSQKRKGEISIMDDDHALDAILLDNELSEERAIRDLSKAFVKSSTYPTSPLFRRRLTQAEARLADVRLFNRQRLDAHITKSQKPQ